MDLDIHNYNIKEIKDLLQLKKSYTVDDVDFNSYDFIKKVKLRTNMTDGKKKEIESFIKLCVKMLKDDLEKKKFKKMLEESKFKSILKNQDKIIQNQYNLAEGLKKLNDKIEVLLENSNKKKIEL
jgi:hypothetical protein